MAPCLLGESNVPLALNIQWRRRTSNRVRLSGSVDSNSKPAEMINIAAEGAWLVNNGRAGLVRL